MITGALLTGEGARCAVIGFPSVLRSSDVVRQRRKRYHPLCSLQTQGQMHVQMKVPSARACNGRPCKEELLADC